MADTYSYSQTPEMPPQRLVTDNQKTPSKFNSNFLYKALSVALVLVVIPYFPSQAPEFINQSIFTRSWELLHLLVVGIAVSYGLFSRRNVESEEENQLKPDSTQAYVSRILQVSNVFDDDVELETPFGFDDGNNKTQTWNSKYFRGNPVVVEEPSFLDEEHSATVNTVSSKPLLLPVRSLRSAVSNSDSVESVGESVQSLRSISRSSSGGKGGSSGRFDKARIKEIDDLDAFDLGGKLKESVVLPSPIPWRSRSGRMEVKEEVDGVGPPPFSLPPSYDEPEINRDESQSFPSPRPRPSQSNSISPPKKKTSPSPSRSPEKRAKNSEDSGRKKRSSHNSTPPPPPPPPLPTPLNRKYASPLSNTHSVREAVPSDKKVMKTFNDELKDFSRSGREEFTRRTDFEVDYLKSEVKPKSQFEAAATSKSVRTIRGSEPITEVKNRRESDEKADGKFEKMSKAVDEEIVDRPRRKSGVPKPQFVSFENQNTEVPRPSPRPTLPKYHKRRNKKLPQKAILESEEYSSSEADESGGNSDTEKAASDIVSDSAPDPNEVDKKADEFIAKFREQIRLQRIASIKKSSGQQNRIP